MLVRPEFVNSAYFSAFLRAYLVWLTTSYRPDSKQAQLVHGPGIFLSIHPLSLSLVSGLARFLVFGVHDPSVLDRFFGARSSPQRDFS